MPHGAGRDLLRYCREQRYGLVPRLRLFVQLCRLTGEIHQRGAIHGRIGPEVALVTPSGRLRLLDAAAGPATPAYAAPEQFGGGAVGAAADVYALGVLLYRLLSGRAPVALGGLSEQQAIERSIREIPALPSVAATPDAPVAPRRLRGDLDAIVSKCLRKNPEERYATALELEHDLRRYLGHRTVMARDEAPGREMKLLMRRHPLLAAAVLFSLMIVTALMRHQVY